LRSHGPVRAPLFALVIFLAGVAGPLQAHMKHLHPGSWTRNPTEALRILRAVYCDDRWKTDPQLYEDVSRMTRDAACYFHGAEDVFYQDMCDPRPWGGDTTAPTALLLGDSNALNLGTMRDGRGILVYDFQSLHGAMTGPVTRDLYRFLVSLVLLANEVGIENPGIDEILHHALVAYHDAAQRFGSGNETGEFTYTADRGNPYVRRMLRQASHRTRADLLDRWTVMTSSGRMFRQDLKYEPLNPHQIQDFQTGLNKLSSGDRDPRFLNVRDAVRQTARHREFHGRERFYVLVEGPTPAPEDDLILEASGGRLACIPPCHYPVDESVQNVLNAAGRLWQSPDPFLGAMALGNHPLVVRELQPWETRVSVNEIGGLEDLNDLARTGGTLLARDHTVTAPAGTVKAFVDSWEKDGNKGEANILGFVERYAHQVHSDFVAFSNYVKRGFPPRSEHKAVKSKKAAAKEGSAKPEKAKPEAKIEPSPAPSPSPEIKF
jgi:hypothetical protein